MIGLRALQRTARTPAFRQPIVTRRWASQASGHGLEGAADNAFNRERQAVKDHAAATSGASSINKFIPISGNHTISHIPIPLADEHH